jgi:DNA-binding transcriptional LysR family regulator
MQFESLKLFCDVVRLGSFSKAALANHVTQSAASQAVSHLERRLGVQLIDRSQRPLEPTKLGRIYFDGCRKLVEQYLELEASIGRAPTQLAMNVQVAAIYSVGLGDMGLYIERFQTQYPDVQIHIEYLHPNRVYEKVVEGAADLGLVSFPRKSRELTTVPWRDEEMVLACSPRHPLARSVCVKPQELAGERYIAFEKGLVIRREVDRFLKEQGVTANVVMQFDNVENIKEAIVEAAGVALLPEPTLRHEVQAGTLVPVPLCDCRFVRPLGIILRRHHKLSTTAQRFIDLVRNGDKPTRTASANGSQTANYKPRSRNNGSPVPRLRASRAPKQGAKGDV